MNHDLKLLTSLYSIFTFLATETVLNDIFLSLPYLSVDNILKFRCFTQAAIKLDKIKDQFFLHSICIATSVQFFCLAISTEEMWVYRFCIK